MGGCVSASKQSTLSKIPSRQLNINSATETQQLKNSNKQHQYFSSIISSQNYNVEDEILRHPNNDLTVTLNSNQNIDNQQSKNDIYSHMATSTIYRISKSSITQPKNQNGKTSQVREIIQQQQQQQLGLQSNQNTINSQIMRMSGTIKQQLTFSKVTFYNENVAIQFTIPKQKAGPILVPYIDYSRYNKVLQK